MTLPQHFSEAYLLSFFTSLLLLLFLVNNFIYLFLAVIGSSWLGRLSSCVGGAAPGCNIWASYCEVASFVMKHRLQGTQASVVFIQKHVVFVQEHAVFILEHVVSVFSSSGFNSCSTWAYLLCGSGVLPDQGLNLYLLCWQADYLPIEPPRKPHRIPS